MGRPGDNIHIPVLNDKFVAAILKVKPTADMPRHTQSEKKSKAAKKPKRG